MPGEASGAAPLPEQADAVDAGEFIQEVEDDLDLDYSGVVQTYADALQAGAARHQALLQPQPELHLCIYISVMPRCKSLPEQGYVFLCTVPS